MFIITRFSVAEAFLIKTMKSVSMSAKIFILNIFPSICFMKCCMKIADSHAYANPNVSAHNIDLATILDLLLL